MPLSLPAASPRLELQLCRSCGWWGGGHTHGCPVDTDIAASAARRITLGRQTYSPSDPRPWLGVKPSQRSATGEERYLYGPL